MEKTKDFFVFRAVNGNNYDGTAFINSLPDSAVFVTVDELTAIGWGLLLEKEQIERIQVRCIRDKRTLEIINQFPPASMGIDGIPLVEAVILPTDIIS